MCLQLRRGYDHHWKQRQYVPHLEELTCSSTKMDLKASKLETRAHTPRYPSEKHAREVDENPPRRHTLATTLSFGHLWLCSTRKRETFAEVYRYAMRTSLCA